MRHALLLVTLSHGASSGLSAPGASSARLSTLISSAGRAQLGVSTRRRMLAMAAAAFGGGPAMAFSPTSADAFTLAQESSMCRTPGCRDAALGKLSKFLDVDGVVPNAKGQEFAHALEIVGCQVVEVEDEPDKPIRVKVKVVADNLDIVDYVPMIWLANEATGQVLAARARTEELDEGGSCVVKYEHTVTRDELRRMADDVLVPRMYCTTHGLWEGKRFTLAQYVKTGGLGTLGYGEQRETLQEALQS